MKSGLLVVILLLPALATAKSGNDLLGDCSLALKLFNHENVSSQPEDLIKGGNCIGFVTGVMNAASLRRAGNSQAKDSVDQFCTPTDVSVEEVVRRLLNRLKSRPEEQDLDAAVVVLRAMNEGTPPETCIEPSGTRAGGLHWPDPPKKVRMRVRLVAVALALPRSSFFSNLEVLVAEKEIGHEEFSLIKLVFTYLPYQPPLSESGFNYSLVHEVSAWRNPDCDETIAQLTTRSLPDRHEPMAYSRNAPRDDLDLRRIALPCYETKADDYIKSSLEPVAPLPEALASALKTRRRLILEPTRPTLQVRPSPDTAQ